ncbi:MAG: ABC transporter permease [Limnochordaceae bacterium]|nr:ABC transporter permease [Limnochordaceae bacterium]
MGRYFASRLGQLILTLFIYITLVYFILQAMPGDITQALVFNPRIPQSARAALQHQLGLDAPLVVQYFHYVRNFFTGNLGVSFSHYPRPVWNILAERIPRTLLLFTTSTLLSFYVGYILGRVIAWRRGGFVDYGATVVGVTFWTAFYPLLALILIWLFASELHWLPLNQFISPTLWLDAPVTSNTIFHYMILSLAGAALLLALVYALVPRWVRRPSSRCWVTRGAWVVALAGLVSGWWASGYAALAWDIVSHMVLPVVTLTLISFAGNMLLMRDSMLETTREDYVLAARAKGLPDRVVRDRHAARTALLPVVTSFALSLGSVMGGGLVTETVFSWPGLGQILFDAAIQADYPLATGALAFTGIFVLVAHLVADVLYAWLDPRISVVSSESEAST